jgi:hypothetical protein
MEKLFIFLNNGRGTLTTNFSYYCSYLVIAGGLGGGCGFDGSNGIIILRIPSFA